VRSATADPNKPGSKPEDEATPPWELYHVSEDPREEKELSKERPEKVGELQALWEKWNRDNVAPLWHYNTPVPGMEAKDEVGG
jgi:arylsulfatase A-like enzyme